MEKTKYVVSYKEDRFGHESREKFDTYAEALNFYRAMAHEDYTYNLRMYCL